MIPVKARHSLENQQEETGEEPCRQTLRAQEEAESRVTSQEKDFVLCTSQLETREQFLVLTEDNKPHRSNYSAPSPRAVPAASRHLPYTFKQYL